jgi:hypothetical protein
MLFIYMLRVTFLLCDMPVRLVPCLVDCKPGKTANRGQVFPYLSLCKENNGAPVSITCVAGHVPDFLTVYALSTHFATQPSLWRTCVLFCSTVTLRFVKNRANRPTTQKSQLQFVLPSVVVTLPLTLYSKVHFISYQIGRCGGFCKT